MSTASNRNGGKPTNASRQGGSRNAATATRATANSPTTSIGGSSLAIVTVNHAGVIESITESAADQLATVPQRTEDIVGQRWDEVWIAAGGAEESADLNTLAAVQSTQLDGESVCLVCQRDAKSKMRTLTWHELPQQPI